MANLHDDRPDASPVAFIVDTWIRMATGYNESRCEGIRRLLRTPPKGRKRDKVARLGVSTSREKTPVWHYPKTFDMGDPCGFWQGVVKPELARKVAQKSLSRALVKKEANRPVFGPQWRDFP